MSESGHIDLTKIFRAKSCSIATLHVVEEKVNTKKEMMKINNGMKREVH
jgi:hypothetical protein